MKPSIIAMPFLLALFCGQCPAAGQASANHPQADLAKEFKLPGLVLVEKLDGFYLTMTLDTALEAPGTGR